MGASLPPSSALSVSAACEAPVIVQYSIDASDRIVFVNDEWVAFARANHGDALLPPAVVKQSLWSFISDATTRQLYHDLLHTVRTHKRRVQVALRCDSPDDRRWLRLDLTHLSDLGVHFTSALLRSERRPHVPLLDLAAPRGTELLTMCSWCKQVAMHQNHWVEIEQAVNDLALFQDDTLPQLTHGICPACLDQLEPMLV